MTSFSETHFPIRFPKLYEGFPLASLWGNAGDAFQELEAQRNEKQFGKTLLDFTLAAKVNKMELVL